MIQFWSFFIRDCRYKAEPLLTIPFCMSLDAGREEDMTFYTLGPVILLSSTNGHWTAWRSMAKRWWGLLWEPPWQPRRDLGGTLITTQVRSSELYVPNCEKLPAEESALITSWKKVVIKLQHSSHMISVQIGLIIELTESEPHYHCCSTMSNHNHNWW